MNLTTRKWGGRVGDATLPEMTYKSKPSSGRIPSSVVGGNATLLERLTSVWGISASYGLMMTRCLMMMQRPAKPASPFLYTLKRILNLAITRIDITNLTPHRGANEVPSVIARVGRSRLAFQ